MVSISSPGDVFSSMGLNCLTLPRALGDPGEIPAISPYNKTVLLQVTSGSLIN